MSLVQGGGQWMVWMLMNTTRAEAQPMFPSAPSDNQQLAADSSSSNHPHPAYQCPTHLAKKVFFWEVTLEGFLVFACLFVFPLIFSFKYEVNFNSLSPVKCGNLPCFCTAPSNDPQFSQVSYLDLISPYWDQGQGICNHFLVWGSQTQEDFSLWRKRWYFRHQQITNRNWLCQHENMYLLRLQDET